MTAPAALPSNMRFDDCDGCRKPYRQKLEPVAMTIEDNEAHTFLTIGVCLAYSKVIAGSAIISAGIDVTDTSYHVVHGSNPKLGFMGGGAWAGGDRENHAIYQAP